MNRPVINLKKAVDDLIRIQEMIDKDDTDDAISLLEFVIEELMKTNEYKYWSGE